MIMMRVMRKNDDECKVMRWDDGMMG